MTISNPQISRQYQKKQLQEFCIEYPSLKCQKKIATLLDLLDNKISMIENEVESLQAVKKAIIKNLFI